MRGLVVAAIGAMAAFLLSADVAAAAPTPASDMAPPLPSCAVSAALSRLDQALARTAARLAAARPLRIVALGSSSTQGFGASSPAHSYPSRLQAELRERLPGRDIVVLNRGVGGEDAREMLARLDRSVLEEKPDLVLWQVGTNALLGDRPMDGEAALIRAGVARLQAAGIDVILIDPQYAPAVILKSNAANMVALLHAIGRSRGVGVFPRFAIMRHWSQERAIPFAQFIAPDGLHMNDWSYDCTARLLADAIVEAANRPGALPTVTATPRSRRGGTS